MGTKFFLVIILLKLSQIVFPRDNLYETICDNLSAEMR